MSAPTVPIDVRQRVQAGAAWLDEHVPHGWWWRIDRAQLDMASCAHCILGQIWGCFTDAPMSLGQAADRGFTITVFGDGAGNLAVDEEARSRQFAELADGWRELIGERLAADERRRS